MNNSSVQFENDLQCTNSYVLNNPLKFTDPSGYQSIAFPRTSMYYYLMGRSFYRYYSDAGFSPDFAAEMASFVVYHDVAIDLMEPGGEGASSGGGGATPAGPSTAPGGNDATSGNDKPQATTQWPAEDEDGGEPEWFKRIETGTTIVGTGWEKCCKYTFSFADFQDYIQGLQDDFDAASGSEYIILGFLASIGIDKISASSPLSIMFATVIFTHDLHINNISNSLEAIEDHLKQTYGEPNVYMVSYTNSWMTSWGFNQVSTTVYYYYPDGTNFYSYQFWTY